MNKTFIASLENHDVYLISTEKVSFYFNISKKKDVANITMDIKYKNRKSVNDVISYYEKIDNYNITLVVPVMDFEENEKLFKKQSNLLSEVINDTYNFLTNNGIEVKTDINVIKHKSTKSDFVDFFLNKFANRVRYLSLDNLVQEEVPYNKIEAANISFVVGRPELELTIKEDDMQEIINKTQELNEQKEVQKPKYNFATGGYISYYLLGGLTAIITLLLMTIIMK